MSTSIFKLLTSIIKQQNSSNTPLTITAIEPGVEIALTDNTNSNVLQYRRDSSASWQPYDGASLILENQGDYVQFQNTNEEWLNTYKNENYESLFRFEQYTNKKYKASGNIQSLLNYTDFVLPYCYQNMFNGCTSLTEAPELPATTLADSCYNGMFNGCTSLTEAPELPATTLAHSCYRYMFENCTSLTSAPELPATTLAATCYQNMFNGCTSLTEAPELPATILAPHCYQFMFQGCTSLASAPEELPATTLASYCYSHMFRGCTSLASAPEELPATTLASSCYRYMFQNCTSLTSAPELPATTLAHCCYESMFQNCTSLTSINVKFTSWHGNTNAVSTTTQWVQNVSSTGTFICPVALPQQFSISNIPVGWTVQTY